MHVIATTTNWTTDQTLIVGSTVGTVVYNFTEQAALQTPLLLSWWSKAMSDTMVTPDGGWIMNHTVVLESVVRDTALTIIEQTATRGRFISIILLDTALVAASWTIEQLNFVGTVIGTMVDRFWDIDSIQMPLPLSRSSSKLISDTVMAVAAWTTNQMACVGTVVGNKVHEYLEQAATQIPLFMSVLSKQFSNTAVVAIRWTSHRMMAVGEVVGATMLELVKQASIQFPCLLSWSFKIVSNAITCVRSWMTQSQGQG